MYIAVLILVVLLSSTYTFRMYFEGYLLGDPFDTRLLVSQLEHWHRFFTGEWTLRDTNFFYPFDKALGFTDAYLIPSIPYSLLRLVEITPVVAWFSASFIFFVFGNLGWVFLAKRLFENKIVQISFVWFIITFPTFTILLERATQILAFSWVSWLTFLSIKTFNDFKQSRRSKSLAVLIIVLLLLMLTSWYPAFFFLVTLFAVMVATILTKHKKTLNVIRENFTIQFFIPTFKALPAIATLFALWIYIYFSILGIASRSWSETIYYSSFFTQVINQQYLNNGWYFYLVKNSEYNAFDKSNVALPWIILILALFYSIKSFWIRINPIVLYRSIILIPTTVIFIIFLRLTEEFSIYKIFWENIPGLESIRFPYRYIIFFGFVLIIFIFINFDHSLNSLKNNKIKYFLAIVFIAFVSLDNLKPPYAIWQQRDYISKELEEKIPYIEKNCDFFILDKPGGWWDDQISAMSITAISGVPTANGYSGGFPPNYPAKPWNFEGDISEILLWSNFGRDNKRGCLVSTIHDVIESNPKSSQIFFQSGFSPEETNDQGAKWRWAQSNKGIVIINTPIKGDELTFKFSLKIPDCLLNNKIKVSTMLDELLLSDVITQKSRDYELTVTTSYSGINQIQFEVEDFACTYPNDPRNLYFEIKNYEVIEK